MTINYTTLLGLAKPVTGTESGQWGDVVNDQITTLVEDAVANASSISVTAGNVTLTTTTGAANQARMSTLIITGSPGTTRNVVAPSQAKVYVVINQSNAAVVVKGAATTGVTIGAGQTAQIAWNGSDFVEIGNYVHGNFVVNGNLSVNGNSTLGDGGADVTTINGQFVGANANISKATTLSTSAPAFFWLEGATYTDTGTAGGTTQPHATFHQIDAPTVNTSNIVTYTNASTLYIAGAPSAAGSATITNPYALFINGGASYFGAAVTMAATTQNLALGTSQTSGTWTAGGAAQTGTITLDQSTKAHTLNLGTGATENATTKTINLGTAGVSGSTTTINIGSAVSGSTTSVTINGGSTTTGAVTCSATTQNIALGTSQTSGTWTAGGAAQTGTITLDQSTKAHTLNIGTGATENVTTKTINIGTAGVSGSTTNLTYGSGVAGSTTTHIWNSGGTEGMRLNSTGLGVGTNSLTEKLSIGQGNIYVLRTGGAKLRLADQNNEVSVESSPTGVVSNMIFKTTATTQMTLDSSGNLGIGTSLPTTKLDVQGPLGSVLGQFFENSSGQNRRIRFSISSNVGTVESTATTGATNLAFAVDGSERMRLDSSGNLGLGVTPSAWSTNRKALQIGGTVAALGLAAQFSEIAHNAISTLSGPQYATSNPAAIVDFNNAAAGGFAWRIAPSGTAGNAITFTQAMTLDASGNLLVGATSAPNGGSGKDVVFHNTASAATYVKISNASTGVAAADGFDLIMGVTSDAYVYNRENGPLVFGTNNTERARITSDGDLCVGRTAGIASERLCVEKDLNAAYLARFRNTNNTSPFGAFISYTAAAPNGTTNQFLRCDDNAATRAEIRSNGGLANYSGNNVNLSDRREKTNFAPAKSYLDTICAIPVQTFEYIDQSPDDPGLTLGVVAQDVQAVAPELVMESNWGTKDDPKMRLSVYQTDLQYALMKCIQEQQELIKDLRARVAALEAQP